MLTVTILAGGLGKRMKSDIPKVLHEVNGIPMIVRILREVDKLKPKQIIIVVGKYINIIKETIQKFTDSKIIYAYQEIPVGTGDAVKTTLSYLDNGYNLILNGDTPLLKNDTLAKIINNFLENNSLLQITAINLSDPAGNGRILFNEQNEFSQIVEEKDCTDKQKKINLVNCGIYMAQNDMLKKFIPKIKNNNAQKEYYLTDIVELYKMSEYRPIGLYILDKSKEKEIININTKEQLDSIQDKQPSGIPFL